MQEKKYLLCMQILFSCLTIFLGNTFWYLFKNSLILAHLLTVSFLPIAFSFIQPIIVFGVYLTCLLLFSFFVKKKLWWGVVIILSTIFYPIVINTTFFTIIGSIIISASFFSFLYTYHNTCVLIKRKTSFFTEFSLSLTTTTFIISIIVAFNFYSLYKDTLSQGNIVTSDQLFSTSLRPIVRLYYDDLNIKNGNEIFADYIKRRTIATHQSADIVRIKTLAVLGLNKASDNDSMNILLTYSLRDTILKIFITYKKQIPLLISFGLGIITQTLLSLGSFLGFFCFLILSKLLESTGIVRKKIYNYPAEKIVVSYYE
jgi:hypothetical protein